jgi:glycosyltransferase involved in cell wall biosynthesis
LDKITKIKEFEEIFLVNDGSLDNSLSIAKKYEKNFTKIKVISYKKNK